MRTASSHPRRIRWLLASAAGLMMLAAGGTASAQPPITGGDSSPFSESFTDTLGCGDEVYDISVDGRGWFHFTYFEETGALFFHQRDHAEIVAVPHDGTGPTYQGHFWDSDQESIRAVRGGDVLVEQDTDLHGSVMHGSDGSMVFGKAHAHFTVNANGEMTVQLDTFRITCS